MSWLKSVIGTAAQVVAEFNKGAVEGMTVVQWFSRGSLVLFLICAMFAVLGAWPSGVWSYGAGIFTILSLFKVPPESPAAKSAKSAEPAPPTTTD